MPYVRNPEGGLTFVPSRTSFDVPTAATARSQLFPRTFAEAALPEPATPGPYRPTVNGTVLASRLSNSTSAPASGVITPPAAPAASAPVRSIAPPIVAPTAPVLSQGLPYTTSPDGRVRSLYGRRVDSLGNFAYPPSLPPAITQDPSVLPAPTQPQGLFSPAAYGPLPPYNPIAPYGGGIGFGGFFPQYGSLMGMDPEGLNNLYAYSAQAYPWVQEGNRFFENQQQFQETVLNNRRDQLALNYSNAGRAGLPIGRLIG